MAYASSRASSKTQDLLAEHLDGAMTDVVVTLANSKIKMKDLFDLQVGDIISTEKDVRTPLDVEVSNAVKFLASTGSYKGRKAIQIQEVCRKARRLFGNNSLQKITIGTKHRAEPEIRLTLWASPQVLVGRDRSVSASGAWC